MLDMTSRFILIVDDDELIRLLVVEYLTDAGFEVAEAVHADHALSLINDNHALLALVFSDIQMPGNLDGIGLAKHMLTHHPHVPVILTSGVRHSQLPVAVHHRFISKPYQLPDVERHIRELVPELA